jgi:hypothetical protein
MGPWDALAAPIPALPLDLFRVVVGALGAAYFARTYREAPLFSGPDGLLDHALQRRLLPFTRITLFPAGASLALLRTAYAVGCAASLLLAAGVAAQPAALVAYVLAVSTYRWNLLLMYVDDAIIHLALFWMVLLPVGHTLALPALLADPTGSWPAWLSTTVSGFTTWCLLANLALIYLVAGLWKWVSPMWRRGWALYAALKMAVSYRPEAWRPSQWPVLMAGNYFALVVEPFLALLAVLPPYAPLKVPLFACTALFHLGIVATKKFPFANLAMLGGGVLYFRDELMHALGAPALPADPGSQPPPGPLDWLAAGTVVCLALLFLTNALLYREHPTPRWHTRVVGKARLNPFYVPLYAVGLAQSYRLFDWIDRRNYHVDYEITETVAGQEPRPVDQRVMFPRSMRHVLLQSYLHGNIWMQLDPAALPELREQILARTARWYCRTHPTAPGVEAEVVVDAVVARIALDNLDLHRRTRTRLARFINRSGEAKLTEACLAPPEYR